MKINDAPIDVSSTLIHKGPKFRSHKFIFDGNVAYLKPTISSLLFCVIYIVVGLFLLALAMTVYVYKNQIDLTIFLGGFGISITTFGCTLIKPFIKQVIFDRNTGKFKNNVDRTVKIDNIMSLQIVNKIVSSKHALSYPCYELNLLTKNGRRINILNHNDLTQLKLDAENLASLLSVELLDLRRKITL